MAKYLYLIIVLFALAAALTASFHPRTPLYKQWKYAGAALLVTVAFFGVWRLLFAQLGVWEFNERYLCGGYLGSLPVEEVLFFIAVACVGLVVYFALKQLLDKDPLFPHQELISSGLIIVLLIAGMYHKDKLYTASVFLILAVFLAFQMLKLRPRYMGKFYLTFSILLVPMVLVSGALTGWFSDEAVVRYSDDHILARLGTVPVEDFFFAMLLMVMPVAIMEWLDDFFYYR